ncbi:MAG: YidC/Oxa1 family membrane protein insertase, partial [Acetatifactor sp.]|nr:YidC/Oxa1 family membrane protein insertase [Acetatifactor sp.]
MGYKLSRILNGVVDVLVGLISVCHMLCHNYWIAIFLFTLLTKVILLPLSIWIQKNSIKTVKMEPELNHIKAVYAGNQELISEEQYKLFKREKYSPFGDLIPLFVQLALMMGVVEAVNRGSPLT